MASALNFGEAAGMLAVARWSTQRLHPNYVFWNICRAAGAVHLDGTPLADLPPLILCELSVPDNYITFLQADQLPAGWNDPYVTPAGLPEFADTMFATYGTLCLGLPSAVVPLSPSRNILLDPLHPLRGQCRIDRMLSYPIDPRLPTAATV